MIPSASAVQWPGAEGQGAGSASLRSGRMRLPTKKPTLRVHCRAHVVPYSQSKAGPPHADPQDDARNGEHRDEPQHIFHFSAPSLLATDYRWSRRLWPVLASAHMRRITPGMPAA